LWFEDNYNSNNNKQILDKINNCTKLLFIDKKNLSRMTNEFVRKINFMNSKKKKIKNNQTKRDYYN
jgi:hypothetical protein